MPIELSLEGRNILVTGGAGFGVGAGICQAVAQAGGKLVVNDLELEGAQAVADRFPGALAVAGDVSAAGDVKRMFAELKANCGVIHGLVNNAGVGLIKAAHEATEADFDRIYSIDVRGLWLMSRAFVEQLLEAGAVGHIVNIASTLAHASAPGYGIYSSAKSAVEGLTRGMAVELGEHGIRCNVVAPGYVHSEQGFDLIRRWTDDPQGWLDDFRSNQQCLSHFIDAIDCGHAAVFLLSDLARSVTGHSLRVDNGSLAMLFKQDIPEMD